MEDDARNPRDRISDTMLNRILDGSNHSVSENCCSQNQTEPPRPAWGLINYPLAMVYAPLQNFCNLYDRDTALEKGTLFSELDLPFMGESIKKGGICRG